MKENPDPSRSELVTQRSILVDGKLITFGRKMFKKRKVFSNPATWKQEIWLTRFYDHPVEEEEQLESEYHSNEEKEENGSNENEVKKSCLKDINKTFLDLIENNKEEDVKLKLFNESIRDVIDNFNDSLNNNVEVLTNSSNSEDDKEFLEDDNRIYNSQVDIAKVPKDIVLELNTFVSELLFLSELGKKHIFNFLIDLYEDKELMHKNKKWLEKLCYKDFFVLWLSPAISIHVLEKKI